MALHIIFLRNTLYQKKEAFIVGNMDTFFKEVKGKGSTDTPNSCAFSFSCIAI